ncbi:MAG TPA: twin-arginine translocase TatA/TatE family subunit [Solirubrobacteraceae bacterium]|nr:twin-arginine translocase TatA/TatE family subunit [Solirubrobacteraceae bacterium]
MVGDILQPTHLLFILVVALLVLGPKRLPEVGRQLGNGLRDFRAALNGERSERAETTPRASVSLDPTPLREEPAIAPQPTAEYPQATLAPPGAAQPPGWAQAGVPVAQGDGAHGYQAPAAQPIDPGYAFAGQAATAPTPGAPSAEQTAGPAATPPTQLG